MSDTLEAPKTEPGKGLAIIADLTPEIFTADKAQEIVASLRAEIMLIDRDVSTKKGRDSIRSMAAKIASSKTAADKFAKNLKDDYQKKANGIQAIRNIFWDGLEALQKEFRQPLTEFEAAEEARVRRHEDGIAAIACLSQGVPVSDTDHIAARLAEAQAIETSGFQEFTKRAEDAKAATIAKLTEMLEESRRRDAERAELERLRKEAAERAAREEAERIEREKQEAAARAAEQAKREAEEKARREAEEAERRAAAERARIEREAREAAEAAERERQRVERERAEAEERAAQAERDRLAAEQRAKEAEEKAERDRIAATERAERDRAEAERRAMEERKAAEVRAQRQAEEAARLERERIEAQRRAEEEETRKREQDKAHRGRINRAAMEALIAAGLSEGAARTAVEAIARGTVPAVKISY